MKLSDIGFRASLAAAALIVATAGAAVASPITLEPDDYAAGTDLSTAGVTLSAVTTNDTSNVVSNIFSAAIDDGITAPTGDEVFGRNGSILFRDFDNVSLKVAFGSAVRTVSIDFGRQPAAQSAMSFAFLQAYDHNGNVVDTATGAGLQSLVTATLTVASATDDIAYVIANSGSGFLALDHLVFDRQPAAPVPTPATLALLAPGLGLIGWMRRRRSA